MIVNTNMEYNEMFQKAGWIRTQSLGKADLVQFTGGADVTSSYYEEEEHPQTGSNPFRDEEEMALYKECLLMQIPMAGICRGGQFLNVMNGGKMYQHVDGHAIAHLHKLRDIKWKNHISVTSTHHQMMRCGDYGLVVAHAGESTFRENMVGDKVVRNVDLLHADTEVVFYPHTQSLCFQPHPEFDRAEACRFYYFALIQRYLKLRA